MHPLVLTTIADDVIEQRLRTAAVVRVTRRPGRRRVWRSRRIESAPRLRVTPARR